MEDENKTLENMNENELEMEQDPQEDNTAVESALVISHRSIRRRVTPVTPVQEVQEAPAVQEGMAVIRVRPTLSHWRSTRVS